MTQKFSELYLQYSAPISYLLGLFFLIFVFKYIFRVLKQESVDGHSLDKKVLLAQLNPSNGFYNFAQAMEVSSKLNLLGIESICEQAPSALMDSIDSYFLKVPYSQMELAQKELQKILSNNNSVK